MMENNTDVYIPFERLIDCNDLEWWRSHLGCGTISVGEADNIPKIKPMIDGMRAIAIRRAMNTGLCIDDSTSKVREIMHRDYKIQCSIVHDDDGLRYYARFIVGPISI